VFGCDADKSTRTLDLAVAVTAGRQFRLALDNVIGLGSDQSWPAAISDGVGVREKRPTLRERGV
jgi:hypothetical protein